MTNALTDGEMGTCVDHLQPCGQWAGLERHGRGQLHHLRVWPDVKRQDSHHARQTGACEGPQCGKTLCRTCCPSVLFQSEHTTRLTDAYAYRRAVQSWDHPTSDRAGVLHHPIDTGARVPVARLLRRGTHSSRPHKRSIHAFMGISQLVGGGRC